ncbi:radial spoke head 14 homolog isoform X2 [Platichthys flesus]|uniref:radial spoke head 14 homolog isoform X2 n=1 Tax=Platichthys flesus TaxID=8260 RepID=UPI002DB95D51|nr:radial spoke head 14 homolog isoform X2 [Platichthys flesus]
MSRDTGAGPDPGRAPVAFGLRAVPRLFEELQQPGSGSRRRALASLCGLMLDPERLHQTVSGGFLEQLKVLLKDEDPSVRGETCKLLHLLSGQRVGREALLSSSLLPPLSQLLDDHSSSCRTNVHRVLNRLTLLPAGADALLSLVPKLMLKLKEEEEEEEVQVLLLSTLSCVSRLDALPALSSDGVSLVGHKLSHRSLSVRREAAAAMMALSVPEDGKRQVCEKAVLPVVVGLLQEEDVEIQANAAGVIMYTVIITAGKQQCLDLDVVPVLLRLLSNQRREEDEEAQRRRRRRKALVVYTLRALTSLAEAPDGRRLLLEQLPLLERQSEATEEDQDIQRAAQTLVRAVTWTP